MLLVEVQRQYESTWRNIIVKNQYQGIVKLALRERALMEVVQSGAKNVEFDVMRRGQRLKVCHSTEQMVFRVLDFFKL